MNVVAKKLFAWLVWRDYRNVTCNAMGRMGSSERQLLSDLQSVLGVWILSGQVDERTGKVCLYLRCRPEVKAIGTHPAIPASTLCGVGVASVQGASELGPTSAKGKGNERI